MRLFMMAGEPSGDRIAADLVRRLRAQTEVNLTGVGGAELAAVGLKSLFPMEDLSVMGFADVLPRLPLLLWRVRQTAQAIIRQRPDVVVLVDAQVFSALVARQVRTAGLKVPMLLYVAPAVWAWKPERAQKLKPLFDEVLSVLPFEPEVMRRLSGPPTHYVGHPALSAFPIRPSQPDRGLILLLPGSRDGELRRHLPLMRAVAERLAAHPTVTGFVLPTPQRLHQRLSDAVQSWKLPVEVVSREGSKAEAFATAVAAVAVTGTVTLELALAGVPMITTYLADKGQAKRWQKYRVQFASLPNVLANKALVPEILSVAPEPERLADTLKALLDRSDAVGDQLAGFRHIRQMMEQGAPEAPLTDPASRVLALARQRLLIGT